MNVRVFRDLLGEDRSVSVAVLCGGNNEKQSVSGCERGEKEGRGEGGV